VLFYIWRTHAVNSIVVVSTFSLWYNNSKLAKDLDVVRKKKEQQAKDTRVQEYELIYILNPEMTDEALETRVNGISEFITGREGVIDAVDKWGKKKLSYPIKHFFEGNYVLTKFKMSPARCKEFEANLRISEDIIRHLLIRVSS
jgi:small subunit ribosomal protein S6